LMGGVHTGAIRGDGICCKHGLDYTRSISYYLWF